MIELEFISGDKTGKTFRPYADRFSIGRSPSNSLVIRNTHISGRHGLIMKKGVEYIFQDLGSTNGTLVRRIGEHIYLNKQGRSDLPLQDGDELVLGAHPHVVEMKVHIRPEDEPGEDGGE